LLQILLAFLNYMLVDPLTMLACTLMPIADCPFIQTKRLDDRLYGTAIGQQDDHAHHRFRIVAQAIKNRSSAGREGLLANVADKALVFLAMNVNVPFSSLTSCRTLHIRAKYLLWVHRSLSRMWKSQEFANEPHFLQVFRTYHVLVGCYPMDILAPKKCKNPNKNTQNGRIGSIGG
jgi:hypothetical protein